RKTSAQMVPMYIHQGNPALSNFQAKQLAITLGVDYVQALFVHYITLCSSLTDAERSNLNELLASDEVPQPPFPRPASSAEPVATFYVLPRTGTISPWKVVKSDQLYDRMTHTLSSSPLDLDAVFPEHPPTPLAHVELGVDRQKVLETIDKESGLSFDAFKLASLVEAFGSNGGLLIRETYESIPQATISAYSDNASVLEGARGSAFAPPLNGDEPNEWKQIKEQMHTLIKVETHNHPTAISPYTGAATGSGAGDVGTVRPQHALKKSELVLPGDSCVVLGGLAMLIGLGGGSASSMSAGEASVELDFASLQRANPEVRRQAEEVSLCHGFSVTYCFYLRCWGWLRLVSGLVASDQMVGLWQLPVADYGVTATSLTLGMKTGEAMAVGERPAVAIMNPAASVRLAVAGSLTNIAAAHITDRLEKAKLSANRMASVTSAGQANALYEGVEAASNFCADLGILVPVGKDSMSMEMAWEDTGEVIAPLSLIASAFAPVVDFGNTWTPVLKRVQDVGNTVLMFVDLALG
ncbi:MAG: hypothetical protein Q9184_001612, partial [Pyrenodesmia sp. 2 TL-2023]